jgi:ABC-type Fe3+-siderophore transport system permease subunit
MYLRITGPKRKSRSSRARSAGGKIFGNPLLKKAMIGIGASAITGTVLGMFAPQLAPIAKPIAGFMTGGIVGGVASVLLSGDGLGAFGSILGGNTASNTGLSV